MYAVLLLFWNIMSNIFSNLLHTYQSYWYDSRLYHKKFWKNPKQIFHWSTRQQLDWTSKAKLIFLLARVQYIILLYILLPSENSLLINGLLAIGLLLFFPYYLIFANLLLSPRQKRYTSSLLTKAKNKLNTFPELIVIGIVWSYWKTTQKEILTHLLQKKYTVLSTVWNQNTLLGVAQCILHHLNKFHQVFIVEMWEDHVGDIQKLCGLVSPHIWIITWVTQQHMDTFNSYNEVIETISEIFSWIRNNGNIYLQKRFPEFEKHITKFSPVVITPPSEIDYLPELKGISFSYKNYSCELKLLAKHTVYPTLVAREIANSLWIDDNVIAEELSWLSHVPHRLSPIYNPVSKIRVIDDTYNGNIEWFKSGIDLLKNVVTSWKKRYITPWLLNVWATSWTIHYDLWRLLASATEKVIFIDNENTQQLAQWLISAWFDSNNIYTYSTTVEAHSNLPKLVWPWDVILFQNDIPDLLL